MPITAQYDREADALYVRLADTSRHRTIEIDETTYIDIDIGVDGRAVGIELLYPSLGLSLEAAAARVQLHHQVPAICRAITEAGIPGVAPTVTGTSYLASTAITTFAVEGTVPAAGGPVGSPGITRGDKVINARA